MYLFRNSKWKKKKQTNKQKSLIVVHTYCTHSSSYKPFSKQFSIVAFFPTNFNFHTNATEKLIWFYPPQRYLIFIFVKDRLHTHLNSVTLFIWSIFYVKWFVFYVCLSFISMKITSQMHPPPKDIFTTGKKTLICLGIIRLYEIELRSSWYSSLNYNTYVKYWCFSMLVIIYFFCVKGLWVYSARKEEFLFIL